MKSTEVFGVTSDILLASYVDRNRLDEEMKKYLSRDTHIAIKGESKSGKTWMRKKNIPTGLIVQCRYGRTVIDIYKDALSQLGINLITQSKTSRDISGSVEATTEAGNSLLMKIGVTLRLTGKRSTENNFTPVGRDINDLKFISEILNGSGRKLIIEDFHYLNESERKVLAFDLKALWDYKCFVVVIGIWAQSNYLFYLNPDLTGRVNEISVYWTDSELGKVIENGSPYLNIEFSRKIKTGLVGNSYQNVGILQSLIIRTLDLSNVSKTITEKKMLNDYVKFQDASMEYAEQLNSYLLKFANTVSEGIRKRQNSTGIYAYTMDAITNASDKDLIDGLSSSRIFEIANRRQPRIQKGNLKLILQKIEEIQVDEDGRGLIVSYDRTSERVFIVDRQLLFYRKYKTVPWPWDSIISESSDSSYETNS